jgi:hypothetical protein
MTVSWKFSSSSLVAAEFHSVCTVLRRFAVQPDATMDLYTTRHADMEDTWRREPPPPRCQQQQ